MNKDNLLKKLNNETGKQPQVQPKVQVFYPSKFLETLRKENELFRTKILELYEQGEKNKAQQLEESKKTIQTLSETLEQAIKDSKVESVEVTNLEFPTIPEKFDIKKPSWYEKFSPKAIISTIKNGFEFQSKSFESALDRHKQIKNALAVRLVDKEGKSYYEAVAHAYASGANTSNLAKDSSLQSLLKALTSDGTDSLDVNIVGGSSSGTQYTEGDTDATITGTVTMWEDAANTLVATSAAKPFPVEIIAGAGSGGTAAADDADFTAGTTSGTPTMGVYESSPTSITDGDMGIVGITSDRKLKVETGLSQPLEDGGNVVVTSSALPTGAATAANQQTDALTDTELRATPVVVDLGANNDVTVAGVSTAANQTTAIGHLATIAGDTTSLDGKDLMLGTDFSDVFGTASLISATPALKVEQQGSVAVTGTFWQATQPVSIAGTVTVDLGANNDVTLATLPDTSAGDLAAINASTDGIEGLLTTIDADTGNLPTIETNTDFGTVTGGGTETGALRVTIANNSTGVVSVDDNGSSLTVDGTVTANLSATDNAVLDTIDAVLDTINAKLVSGTDIGDVTINNSTGASAVNIQDGGNSITVDNGGTFATQPTYTGATPYHLVSAATTNATSVKGSAGVVYGIYASNVNAAARYLKLYNKASAPTVGTDTPVHTFIIPGNTAGAGTNIPIPVRGINFSTGIAFALTTEATDAGTTAVAASEIVVNLDYI